MRTNAILAIFLIFIPTDVSADEFTFTGGGKHYTLLKTSSELAFLYQGMKQSLKIQSCNKKLINNFWTKTTDKIQRILGPWIVKHRSLANSTRNHEYGHLMFEALTKKEISRPTKAWDTRVRTCLNDQVYADPKYEKENYADFYSGLFSESTSDLMCEFALQSSVENYANLSLENPDPEDDHPGDLFRLLHIHYIQSKGKMAPACLEALKELGEPTPPFKNCFAIQ